MKRTSKPATKPTTIGYLRVSTGKQGIDGQRLAILDYARRHNLTVHSFISATVSARKASVARRIDELLDTLNPGDTLIVAELSRLGRSLSQIVALVDELIKRRIKLVAIKEGIKLNGDGKKDIQTTVQVGMFSMFAEIESLLISERTKEGLAAARAAGKLLGRPKGPGKSKLDKHRDDILEDLQRGVPKTKIARRYGTSAPNLHHWLRQRKIKIEEANSP